MKQAGSLFKHLIGQQDMILGQEILGLLLFLETLVEFLKLKWDVI